MSATTYKQSGDKLMPNRDGREDARAIVELMQMAAERGISFAHLAKKMKRALKKMEEQKHETN